MGKNETEVNPRQFMTYWKASETLTLGNHFHGLSKITFNNLETVNTDEECLDLANVLNWEETFNPDWRVDRVEIDEKDLIRLSSRFSEGDIDSCSLCMALESDTQESVNIAPWLCLYLKNEFEPIFSVKLSYRGNLQYKKVKKIKERIDLGKGNSVKQLNKLLGLKIAGLNGARDGDAAEVPVNFLNAVSRNWMLLDPAQIDDLFMAHKPETTDNTPKRLQRLTKYDFNKGKNRLLFNKLKKLCESGKLRSFKMHFGADMNKLTLQDEYTFTPVIELGESINSQSTLEEHFSDMRNAGLGKEDLPVLMLATNDEEPSSWLFEYIQPCPPC